MNFLLMRTNCILHYSKDWYSIMLVNQAMSIMRVNGELAM